MKKHRKTMILFLILVLCVSLWKNYSFSAEKRAFRDDMLSDSFYTMKIISLHLDPLITASESEPLDYGYYESNLKFLSVQFRELHFSLKTHAEYFPPSGKSRDTYSSIIDFDFIAGSLIDEDGEINGAKYHGILSDKTISDKEILYLKTLKEDLDVMTAGFASEEDPQKFREKITSDSADRIIDKFFGKWTNHNDSSPIYLLFEKAI